jgi:hypothetical protein
VRSSVFEEVVKFIGLSLIHRGGLHGFDNRLLHGLKLLGRELDFEDFQHYLFLRRVRTAEYAVREAAPSFVLFLALRVDV